MTAVLSLFDPLDCLTQNQRVLLEINQTFSEVEDDDSRLAFVLAYSRIHQAAIRLLDDHKLKQANGRKPGLWKTQTKTLHQAGLLEPDYLRFLITLARIRNGICHRPTTRDTLVYSLPYYQCVVELHQLCSGVQFWSNPVSPEGDLHRSVLAICVAGCLAIELEGTPKGFQLVTDFQQACSNG